MRGNGEGSVYRASGKRSLPWCATVTEGWTLAGRPVRRSRFAATKADAVLALNDMLAARRQGRPIADDRLTLKAFLPAWLEGRSDLRPSTVRVWQQAADHLLRRLGTLRVRHLTPTDVEAACAEMPPGVAAVARTMLGVALADAERDGTTDRNVARLSRPRRVSRAAVLSLDARQARALIAACSSHRLGALYVAALGTGLRQGELLGLMRDCLDLDAGTARIEWTLGWVAGEPVLGRPKTESSRRTVPLAPFVVAALKAHRARQDAERLAAGRKWRDADGFVFTTVEGWPISGNTARWVLDSLCGKAGLGHVKFHSLRKTALQLVTERASQKAAQTLAGHSSITMTDRYTHPTDVLARAAAGALQEAIGS